MNRNEWIESKILKLNKKDIEDYPNQIENDFKRQAQKYNFDVIDFQKNHYELKSVLKDKLSDKSIYIYINDLTCFKDQFYSNVSLHIMKNERDTNNRADRCSCFHNIGLTSRELVEWKKRQEEKQIENDLDEIERD